MNDEVSKYIEKQASPQKEICQKLREIIFNTFPDIKEEMKWGVPTYADGLYYIVALKDHVNIGFSIQGLSKEEIEQFDGSGKTMRHIQINSVDQINSDRIIKTLQFISKNHEDKS